MNTPTLALKPETDATRGDLRPSEDSPRPIPCLEKRSTAQIEGRG